MQTSTQHNTKIKIFIKVNIKTVPNLIIIVACKLTIILIMDSKDKSISNNYDYKTVNG
jgi:hypothetical protein